MSKVDIYQENIQTEESNIEEINQLIIIIQSLTDKISELQSRIEVLEGRNQKVYEKKDEDRDTTWED